MQLDSAASLITVTDLHVSVVPVQVPLKSKYFFFSLPLASYPVGKAGHFQGQGALSVRLMTISNWCQDPVNFDVPLSQKTTRKLYLRIWIVNDGNQEE
jgi:hypothetical protein